MADMNDVPGGAAGVVGIVAVTGAAVGAAWRMFKTWAPNDANAAANSSAQIAALDSYKEMLEDERTARNADALRAATELQAVRTAWEQDVRTRSADYMAERTARLNSDAKREEAMQELWVLRGQVQSLTEQVRALETRMAQQGK